MEVHSGGGGGPRDMEGQVHGGRSYSDFIYDFMLHVMLVLLSGVFTSGVVYLFLSIHPLFLIRDPGLYKPPAEIF